MTSMTTYVLVENLPRNTEVYRLDFYAKVEGDISFWLLRPDFVGNMTSLTAVNQIDVSSDKIIIGYNQV